MSDHRSMRTMFIVAALGVLLVACGNGDSASSVALTVDADQEEIEQIWQSWLARLFT